MVYDGEDSCLSGTFGDGQGPFQEFPEDLYCAQGISFGVDDGKRVCHSGNSWEG